MEFDFYKLKKNSSKIEFEKVINIYDIINRIKSLDYVSPHKFFKIFLDKTLNESSIIVAIKMFYDGVLKDSLGDWVKVDYKISNMSDMSNLKIIFELKKLYNRNIIFESEEERKNKKKKVLWKR